MKIHLPTALIISLVLLLAAGTLFVLDIRDYGAAHELTSFSAALSQKMGELLAYFDSFFSAFTGILAASLQIVSGAMRMTPIWVQLAIVAGVVLAAWLLKKAIAALGS